MTREKKLRLLKCEGTERIKKTQRTDVLLQNLYQNQKELKIQLQEVEKMLHTVAKQLAILDLIDTNIDTLEVDKVRFGMNI